MVPYLNRPNSYDKYLPLDIVSGAAQLLSDIPDKKVGPRTLNVITCCKIENILFATNLYIFVVWTISFTCLMRFMCLSVYLSVWTDENWNFSAVRSPIELKLGGDLGLVSQISEK
jgi:hypothetical protein